MINYIKADLYRLVRRIPRILMVSACNLLLFGIILYRYFTNWNAFQFCDATSMYFKYLGPAILGLVELSAVYADDFRAKTMQVAIGIGVSRPMVVLTKLIEFIIVVVLDLFICLVIAFAAGNILGAGLVAEQWGDLITYLFSGLLNLICYSSIAMIPMFFTQSTNLGMLLYILCAIPLIPALINGLLTFGPLAQFRLDNYMVFNLLDQFGAYMLTRTFNLGVTLGIIVYLVIFYLVTVLLFRKRELEF